MCEMYILCLGNALLEQSIMCQPPREVYSESKCRDKPTSTEVRKK